ncbi:protein FAR1-RELATED SEQUENCE 6, partial [Trifolium medium]|nr:protein FAR1-RELATED SEQUENCE 6 [Trifolium medium]
MALMNDVAQVFPISAALVCRFHVEKNVSTKVMELVKDKNGDGQKASVVWERVGFAFKNLLDSATEEEYAKNVLEFKKLCEKWPKILRYVEETVLDTDKKK